MNLALVLAIAIVAPNDGVRVPLLRAEQRDYLVQNRETRFNRLDDAAYRHRLIEAGHIQPPVRLAWTNAASKVVTLTIEGERSQTFSLTNLSAAYVTNLELGRIYRWSVADGEGVANGFFETESMPPRLMRIGGVVNARDLGGWTGLDGRRVRQGLIFHSSGLRGNTSNGSKSIFSSRFVPGKREITDEGIAVLRDDIGIRTDIEVRGVTESVCMTESILGPHVTFVKEPFAAYNFIDNLIRGREPFAKIFRSFVSSENYPIIFHCAGGRDRSGTLAFILLGLLGASDDDLCREWEATIFSEENTEFGSARIGRLLIYLKSLGGNTYAEDCEIYARSCGITDDEIAAYRAIMLEEGGVK